MFSSFSLSLLTLPFVLFFQTECLDIVPRVEWGAANPKFRNYLADQLRYVILHHSYIPSECYTKRECMERMRTMQHMHMIDNGWDDIGYNFAIGHDGNIYEGRGFNVQGAHAPGYNNKSIGIVLIGDWSDKSPSSPAIRKTDELIAYSIGKGYIQSDYTLYGHRQVRTGTECPGDALFERIKSWRHWQTKV